jgi:hypothetical protein
VGSALSTKDLLISTNIKKAALTTLPLHNLFQLLVVGCSKSDYHKLSGIAEGKEQKIYC